MRHRITSWVLKGLAAGGLAASLSACNMVVTTEPMFLAQDQATPALREGLWVNPKDDCEFDIKTPATKWPECAQWIVIKGSSMTGTDEKGKDFVVPFVLAAGEPRVMQVKIEDDKKAAVYVYLGLRALKFDKQGQIVSYTGWLTQCGPPPPKDAKRPDGNPRYGSLQPSPGLIMDDDLSGCAPEDKAALIRAAGLSEAYEEASDKDDVSRWVRDGDK